MDLKSFIGEKIMIADGRIRCVVTEITSPYIKVRTVSNNSMGYPSTYIFDTINGDPISRGILKFEDASLNEPFKNAYGKYCRSMDAYYEEIGYWSRKD